VCFDSSSLKIGDQCSSTDYTVGYGYKHWYNATEIPTTDGTVKFKFYVQAESDAHIMLAREPASPGYEIVLGGGSNTFCDIRKFDGYDVTLTFNIIPIVYDYHSILFSGI